MSYQGTPQMQANASNNNGVPREWRFDLFDCFGDMGLCKHIYI